MTAGQAEIPAMRQERSRQQRRVAFKARGDEQQHISVAQQLDRQHRPFRRSPSSPERHQFCCSAWILSRRSFHAAEKTAGRPRRRPAANAHTADQENHADYRPNSPIRTACPSTCPSIALVTSSLRGRRGQLGLDIQREQLERVVVRRLPRRRARRPKTEVRPLRIAVALHAAVGQRRAGSRERPAAASSSLRECSTPSSAGCH